MDCIRLGLSKQKLISIRFNVLHCLEYQCVIFLVCKRLSMYFVQKKQCVECKITIGVDCFQTY